MTVMRLVKDKSPFQSYSWDSNNNQMSDVWIRSDDSSSGGHSIRGVQQCPVTKVPYVWQSAKGGWDTDDETFPTPFIEFDPRNSTGLKLDEHGFFSAGTTAAPETVDLLGGWCTAATKSDGTEWDSNTSLETFCADTKTTTESKTFDVDKITGLAVDAKGAVTTGKFTGDNTSTDLKGDTITAATKSDDTKWDGKEDLNTFCAAPTAKPAVPFPQGCKSITVQVDVTTPVAFPNGCSSMTVVWLGQGSESKTFDVDKITGLVVDKNGFCSAGTFTEDKSSTDLKGDTVIAATKSDKTKWDGEEDLTKFCTDAQLSGCTSITMSWRKVKQLI